MSPWKCTRSPMGAVVTTPWGPEYNDSQSHPYNAAPIAPAKHNYTVNNNMTHKTFKTMRSMVA